MTTTVGIIYKNSSAKFMLVKNKSDQSSKKKTEEVRLYGFPMMSIGDEDTKEFVVNVLKDRLIECNENLDHAIFLTHENDDLNIDFYYIYGDYEISKNFYEHYESFLFVGIDEYENLSDISEDTKLVFNSLKYIDATK